MLSYFIGQKKYPVDYKIKDMAVYLIIAGALYAISVFVHPDNVWLRLGMNTLMLFLFVAYIIKKDLPLKSIPVKNRFVR